MGFWDFLTGDNVTNPQYQNGQYMTGVAQNGIAGALGHQAPQLDPTQQAQFRNMQMQQAQQLQRIASGQQQGAGELAAQRQAANAAAQQQAMARMGRGPNAALAFRGAANNVAGIGLNAAGQGQQAALQDQQMAQGALTGALGQGRGQDLSLSGQNANLQEQNFANQNQAALGYLNNMSGLEQGRLGMQQQANMAQNQFQQGLFGAGMNALSGVGGLLSDETQKTDIAPTSDADLDEMLSSMHAYNYRYKDEAKHGEGERAGVMAQDVAKSKLGRQMIVETDDGMALDGNKLLSGLLASVSYLNRKVKERAR
jgi:hypothetical protein